MKEFAALTSAESVTSPQPSVAEKLVSMTGLLNTSTTILAVSVHVSSIPGMEMTLCTSNSPAFWNVKLTLPAEVGKKRSFAPKFQA